MNAKRAIALAILLPLLTTPIDLDGDWFGVPTWASFSLLVTGVVAMVVATWMSRWWKRLAEEAERSEHDPVGR